MSLRTRALTNHVVVLHTPRFTSLETIALPQPFLDRLSGTEVWIPQQTMAVHGLTPAGDPRWPAAAVFASGWVRGMVTCLGSNAVHIISRVNGPNMEPNLTSSGFLARTGSLEENTHLTRLEQGKGNVFTNHCLTQFVDDSAECREDIGNTCLQWVPQLFLATDGCTVPGGRTTNSAYR
jgi:hypothetical protein